MRTRRFSDEELYQLRNKLPMRPLQTVPAPTPNSASKQCPTPNSARLNFLIYRSNKFLIFTNTLIDIDLA